MKARNHITVLRNDNSGVAKGVEEVEHKAKAEVVQSDPVNASDLVEKNSKQEVALDKKKKEKKPE